MKRMLRAPSLTVLFVLLVMQHAVMSLASASKSITVPTDFATLQGAIDAARPGDTINVLRGTYAEQVTISKDLHIVGAGVGDTIIKAPAVLNPRQVNPRPGRAVIVEIFNGAGVSIERLAIAGPSGTVCPGLAAFSVQQGATLGLDSALIAGCSREGMLVGFDLSIPGGPGLGHATITATDIIDYRAVGIQAGGPGTTINVSHSRLRNAANSEFVTSTGIVFADGTIASIDHTQVSGNLCNDAACGPDFFNQLQAAAILGFDPGAGSVVSHNDVSDNDVGIAIGGHSGCCEVSHNDLQNNRYFGIIFVDGNHTSSQDTISGGAVGVAVVATSVNSVGTFAHDKVTDTLTPVQELSCCGVTAHAVVVH